MSRIAGGADARKAGIADEGEARLDGAATGTGARDATAGDRVATAAGMARGFPRNGAAGRRHLASRIRGG